MGASKYNLAADIQVRFPIGYDYDIELLVQQIREADRVDPWVSRYTSGASTPSIAWISPVAMEEGGGIDRHYTVEIRPHFLHTLDQAYAYERYANNLARNLAAMLPPETLGVSARLIVKGCHNEVFVPAR